MKTRLLACAVALALTPACSGQKPTPTKEEAHPAPASASPRPSLSAPTASKPAAKPPLPVPGRSAAKPAPAVRIEAAPAGGTLHIESDVPGAQVFIDRQFIGATPITASNVSPGVHQLNVSAAGYDGISQSVDVEPGPRDLLFKLKEVRLDAAIDVVHKHRIGSCKGRLSATPQGIRFDTTDSNDGFTAPLSALERFDVDYLAKTLHLKLMNGRQYDFTDPAGNADHLFVFQRDVAAAKKKLTEAP